jgi:hypothetical protein
MAMPMEVYGGLGHGEGWGSGLGNGGGGEDKRVMRRSVDSFSPSSWEPQEEGMMMIRLQRIYNF